MLEQDSGTIDLQCLHEYTDDDPEMMKELIEVFFETCSESIATMGRHIIDGKSAEWTAEAHKLKGASGYVGAHVLKSLSSEAQSMEQATKQDRQEKFDQIETEYSLVKSKLEQIEL